MSDIIQLLPDSVANQIAAGEVVQRPASVVKELVENAIDAGSTKIQVIIKDAGRTLIQVVDNGCGMSENDARMCFERHATSKIRKANDLFDIRTMGFRGEAMASIAGIATVELKTKKQENEVGTFIRIHGSMVESQQPVSCQNGTNILVKNLFFNVPARRKFLKSNSTELKHIMEEFQRVALGFPEIEMQLVHNDVEIYNLPASKIYHRILNVLGRSASQNLVPIQSETSMASIRGYVGKPEHARRTPGEQFFFVNNRFMRHPYFFKAVVSAYQDILAPQMLPSFFLYFDVNPDSIDINIHPTKTEIKFEHEKELWPIILATVKEGLGKHNIVPSIDFNRETIFDVPMLSKNQIVAPPEIKVNPDYNPFEPATRAESVSAFSGSVPKKSSSEQWEQLYTGFESKHSKDFPDRSINDEPHQQIFEHSTQNNQSGRFFQVKGKYILTAVKSGLMLIDQKRAHERILYDEYIYKTGNQSGIGQKLLYPQKIELDPVESELLKPVLREINRLGFEVSEFGNHTIIVNSIPADFPGDDASDWIRQIVDHLKENQKEFKETLRENLVKSLAKFLSIPYGKILAHEEMAHINDKLFASKMPNLSPDGKTIITIVGMDELEKKFK